MCLACRNRNFLSSIEELEIRPQSCKLETTYRLEEALQEHPAGGQLSFCLLTFNWLAAAEQKPSRSCNCFAVGPEVLNVFLPPNPCQSPQLQITAIELSQFMESRQTRIELGVQNQKSVRSGKH